MTVPFLFTLFWKHDCLNWFTWSWRSNWNKKEYEKIHIFSISIMTPTWDFKDYCFVLCMSIGRGKQIWIHQETHCPDVRQARHCGNTMRIRQCVQYINKGNDHRTNIWTPLRLTTTHKGKCLFIEAKKKSNPKNRFKH